jgi:hypothetical protein
MVRLIQIRLYERLRDTRIFLVQCLKKRLNSKQSGKIMANKVTPPAVDKQ